MFEFAYATFSLDKNRNWFHRKLDGSQNLNHKLKSQKIKIKQDFGNKWNGNYMESYSDSSKNLSLENLV